MNAEFGEGSTAGTESAMLASGVATEEPQEVDYFGFEEHHEFVLPDGRQKIFYSAMNEGAKAEFQKMTSRDLRVQRSSGDALVKMDQAAERHALISKSVTGWSLRRRNPKTGQWENAPFDSSNLKRFLSSTNPRIVEDLERDIRKANPWLMDEMSVEEIDKEIENLQEMREVAKKREEGKELSVS